MQIQRLETKTHKDEAFRFVRKHHYSRAVSAVAMHIYAIIKNGTICAVTIYGQPPSPSVMRSFLKNPELHQKQYLWHSRLIGKGITQNELDQLIYFAHEDLYQRGYFLIHSYADPRAYLIDSPIKYLSPGFTGRVYERSNALYFGTTKSKNRLSHFIIDNQVIHTRQGAKTLTQGNVKAIFPNAKSIRPIYSGQKRIFAWILSKNQSEFEKRLELIKYKPIPFEILKQPRLLRVLEELQKRTNIYLKSLKNPQKHRKNLETTSLLSPS